MFQFVKREGKTSVLRHSSLFNSLCHNSFKTSFPYNDFFYSGIVLKDPYTSSWKIQWTFYLDVQWTICRRGTKEPKEKGRSKSKHHRPLYFINISARPKSHHLRQDWRWLESFSPTSSAAGNCYSEMCYLRNHLKPLRLCTVSLPPPRRAGYGSVISPYGEDELLWRPPEARLYRPMCWEYSPVPKHVFLSNITSGRVEIYDFFIFLRKFVLDREVWKLKSCPNKFVQNVIFLRCYMLKNQLKSLFKEFSFENEIFVPLAW